MTSETAWAIRRPKSLGGSIAVFTVSGYRKGAVEKWLSMWSQPKPWRGFYRDGYRNVRVTITEARR